MCVAVTSWNKTYLEWIFFTDPIEQKFHVISNIQQKSFNYLCFPLNKILTVINKHSLYMVQILSILYGV